MSDAPIIIKKIKKGGHGGHHGGAWKVAYADFVTAMMAFFLLMWLLNATSEEQKRGLSNYFGPAGLALGAGGTGGILGGISIETEGQFGQTKSSTLVPMDSSNAQSMATESEASDNGGAQNAPGDQNDPSQDNVAAKKNLGGEPQADNPGVVNAPNFQGIDSEKGSGFSQKEASNMMQDYEEQLFNEASKALKKSLKDNPAFKDVADNLKIDITREGLRIQIIDKNKISMFPSGSAVMYPKTKEIINQIVKAVQKLPNKISISGHTDAKPYASKNGYTNWELSTDRANATRRELIEDGLFPDRIASVVGRAEKDPLLPQSPESDQNRRISIMLLREPSGKLAHAHSADHASSEPTSVEHGPFKASSTAPTKLLNLKSPAAYTKTP